MTGAWEYFWSPWSTTPKVKQVSAGEQLFGLVPNLQSGTAYTIVPQDNAHLLVLGNASPVAVTLNAASSYPIPFFLFVQNTGVGTATITPGGGSTIDGASSLTLTQNQGTILFSNGTNFYTMRGMTGGGSGAQSIHSVTPAPDGSTTAFTIVGGSPGAYVNVYIDGLFQGTPVNYSISGALITFTSAPLAGQQIEVVF
jgi:hypothetical protein